MAAECGIDINERSLSPENPNTPFDRVLDMLTFGQPSSAGMTVGPDSALNFSTVFCCISILSDLIASTPLLTYRRVGSGGKERARDHYAYDLLTKRVNPRMTAHRWKKMMAVHQLSWGNAFSIIEVSPNGRVTALWPVHPRFVRWDAERDVYLVQGAKGEIPVSPDYMLHFRDLETNDSGMGISRITKARESIGLALAQENYASSFYSNGATMSGFFKMPEKLSGAAKAEMYRYLEGMFAGAKNSRKMGILDASTEFVPLSVKPSDAEFLASRKLQRSEICAWFGVPPHMIGDMEGTKYGNLTEQEIAFVRRTLRPHASNWASEINNSLFSVSEGKTVFTEFLLDALLSADPKTLAEVLNVYRQNGVINADEIRALLNLNPIGGEDGQAYLVNGNMVHTAAAMAGPQTNQKALV